MTNFANFEPTRSIANHLDAHEVDYTLMAQPDSVAPEDAVKTLLVKTAAGYALAAMSLSDKLSSRQLKETLGSSKLRFADTDELLRIMQCRPGSCHPFGSIVRLSVVLDERVADRNTITCSAGAPGTMLTLLTRDYISLEEPTIADIATVQSAT